MFPMSTPDLTVFWNEETLKHRAPDGAFPHPDTSILAEAEPHPDRRERIENIKRMIEVAFGGRARFESVDPAPRLSLERVHDPEYLEWLEEFFADGGGRIEDTTTGGNEHTFDAARHAANAAVRAAQEALENNDGVPYALCRPSGHHAQPDCADGFCFLNNVAIAAAEALSSDADRVAVVDWDVHHGNGTQEIFYDREDVLFISLHNDHGAWHPEYHPQEGSLEEDGIGKGEGYTVNVPLPPGTGDAGYQHVFDRIIEPIVRAYDPDLLLASAGQDAGVSDPLARNLVTRGGFENLTARVRALAAETTGGRFALIQEGGYQPSHLAFATLGVLEGALDTSVELEDIGRSDPFGRYDENLELAEKWTDRAAEHHASYWPID